MTMNPERHIETLEIYVLPHFVFSNALKPLQ